MSEAKEDLRPYLRGMRRLVAANLALLSVAAVTACGTRSNDKQYKLDIPGVTTKLFSKGNRSFTLPVDPISAQGPGKHSLKLAVNMDCDKTGVDFVKVRVNHGALLDFTTHICNETQTDPIDIYTKDAAFNADKVSFDVTASRPTLHWVVGVQTSTRQGG